MLLFQFTDLTVLAEQQRSYYSASDPKEKSRSKWSDPSGCTNAFQHLSSDELEKMGAGEILNAGLADQAHNEFLYEAIWYPQANTKYGSPQANTSYISLTVSNMAALSKGSVKIDGNSGLGDPVIDPNVSVSAMISEVLNC